MQWLSQGVPVGAKIEGQGLKKIDFILRAADPKKGKAIFIALKIYYFILLNFLTRSSKSCIELIALGLI